jgi:hypothetical protein
LPPEGLADPVTPAYDETTGFTPDAVRIGTLISLQVSLERYRDAKGAYPESLAALFPDFAPPRPDHRPLAGPSAPSDGYSYTRETPAAFTLSVVLASGQAYTLHAMGAP